MKEWCGLIGVFVVSCAAILAINVFHGVSSVVSECHKRQYFVYEYRVYECKLFTELAKKEESDD